MARPTTPSVRAASIIAGKIVTMSNVTVLTGLTKLTGSRVHIQQPVRRIDHDAFARDIDRPAYVLRQRDQNLARAVPDNEPAAAERAFDPFHRPNRPPVFGHHRAASEIVMVVRAV